MFSSHSGLHIHPRGALALLLAVFSFLSHPARLSAQSPASPNPNPHHLDGNSIGGPLDISDVWLVHGGDDPSFASPQLDDSAWQAISGSNPLNTYGIHDQPIVWYRLHVQVPPSQTDLALMLHRFDGSFEAYVNGVRIGQLGGMSGGGQTRLNAFQHVMNIPASALDHGNLVIAIRAAIGDTSKGERLTGGINDAKLGRSTDLLQNAALSSFRDRTSGGYEFLLQSVTLLILLALIIALPEQREYVYLTLAFAFAWTNTLFDNVASGPWFNISYFAFYAVVASLINCKTLALVQAIHLILGKLWGKWIRIIQFSLLAYLVVLDLALRIAFHLDFQLSASSKVFYYILASAAWSPFVFVLPGLLLWEWIRRRNHDAGFLLVPVLVGCAYEGFFHANALLHSIGVAEGVSGVVPVKLLSVTWDEIADAFVNLSLLAYIIFRVVRTVRAGAHYEAEVEAAHTVQQVLLSRSTQATPGFKVETVYLPASEVGGDFFLVSPTSDGALIAVVGDVAGKGMLAAMRVSVILGALRREESSQPSHILECLNEAMMRQGDMGMTTACCVRLEPDGRFVVANAGHIAPYITGQEFLTAGALPLGIVSGTTYQQTEGRLQPGETIVLMSDGVVEARSEKLGLYGFERLAPLTTLPAHHIAETAKAFGQEDDITVVTVTCAA